MNYAWAACFNSGAIAVAQVLKVTCMSQTPIYSVLVSRHSSKLTVRLAGQHWHLTSLGRPRFKQSITATALMHGMSPGHHLAGAAVQSPQEQVSLLGGDRGVQKPAEALALRGAQDAGAAGVHTPEGSHQRGQDALLLLQQRPLHCL